jgi:hypothetical protein
MLKIFLVGKMPLQIPPKQQLNQTVRNFIGVDTRRDETQIDDGLVAESVNFDLHVKPGVAVVRHRTLTVNPSLGGVVNQIRRFGNSLIYIVGSSIYENGILISTALSSESFTSLVSYQGLTDTDSRIYIANKGAMRRLENNTLFDWGIAPPNIAPTVIAVTGSGNLDGTVSYVYTYLRKSGAAIVSESNPSPATTLVFATESASVTVTASIDPQVTHIRIYRTQNNGVISLFDEEVTNSTQLVFSSKQDIELGSAIEANHGVPPASDLAIVHNDRIFIADSDSNRLFFSSKFNPEYFGSFIDIGSNHDRIQGLASFGGVLGVFTEETKYRIVEHLVGVDAVGTGIPFIGAQAVGFTAIEAISRRGTRSPAAIINTDSGIIFPAKDGVYLTTFEGPDQLISNQIESLFVGRTEGQIAPVDWNVPEKFSAAFFKNRYYFAYQPTDAGVPNRIVVYSLETGGWYFYARDATALYYDEENDIFYIGTADGGVQSFEAFNANSDEAAFTATLITRYQDGQNIYQQKLFTYYNVDVDIPSTDTVTVNLLVDGVSRHSVTIQGPVSRSRRLRRLPAGILGEVWGLKFEVTGGGQTEIHGARLVWIARETQ